MINLKLPVGQLVLVGGVSLEVNLFQHIVYLSFTKACTPSFKVLLCLEQVYKFVVVVVFWHFKKSSSLKLPQYKL